MEWWVGQRVTIASRVATHEEVSEAKRRLEDEEWHHDTPAEDITAKARFARMMEDIHKLAVSPHGDALMISTFSEVVPPPKNEATFSQWVHEVQDALGRFPEATVRNWITRSLRGATAELVRDLGPNPAVETVLRKLHIMHGAVAPLDMMMRRLFNISQNKGVHVSQFATRLETALSNIQHDHPGQLTKATIQNSLRDHFYQGLKKAYKDSLFYLYAAKAPYEDILTTARATEAEQEDYKEVGGATLKSAQAPHPEVMEQLASIQAVVKKAWNAQQNSQQKQKKSGDGRKDNNNNPTGKRKKNDACFGCGGTGHFIKDCPNLHKSSLNSKRGRKKSKPPPHYKQEEDRNFQPGRGYFTRRGTDPRGWARTGLEPVALVYLNFVPFDTLLDVGSSISMIDVKVCEKLGLPINPFSCDISHCVGVEGALMTRSLICIMGWIEVEVGILGMGCILARFWITDCKYDKGVPVMLGSHQIKKVYREARKDSMDLWPSLWKDIYMWSVPSSWFGGRYPKDEFEDLYDSDDYDSNDCCSSQAPEDNVPKQVVKSSSLSSADSWLELAMKEEDEDTVLERVEAKIAASSSTALKSIPLRVMEAMALEACQDTPTEEGPPEKEAIQNGNGDENSVFPDWLAQLGSVVGGLDDLKTCNSAGVVGQTLQLPANSIVSCRITPTGETTFSFQWSKKDQPNSKNCSG